jgi:hypothetical protein
VTIQPFGLIEMAVKELVEAKYAPAEGKVGGDLSYTVDQDLYVWIGLIPGGGSSDEIEGTWAVDIDVFGNAYATAMGHALALEAILLTPGGHVTDTMRVDSVTQNSGPSEGPWDDDAAWRISATYVFTARRPG